MSRNMCLHHKVRNGIFFTPWKSKFQAFQKKIQIKILILI